MGRDGTEAKTRAPATKASAPATAGTLSADEAARLKAEPRDARHLAILALLSEDDGWLRVVPSDGGRTVYCKWKWTSGPLRNRYVMTVGPLEQLFDLLRMLADKRDAGASGTGPTAADRYHVPN